MAAAIQLARLVAMQIALPNVQGVLQYAVSAYPFQCAQLVSIIIMCSILHAFQLAPLTIMPQVQAYVRCAAILACFVHYQDV